MTDGLTTRTKLELLLQSMPHNHRKVENNTKEVIIKTDISESETA